MSTKKVGQDGEYQHLLDKKKFYSFLFKVTEPIFYFNIFCKINLEISKNV